MPRSVDKLCEMALDLVREHGHRVSHIELTTRLHPEIASMFGIDNCLDDKLVVRFAYPQTIITPEEQRLMSEGCSPEDRAILDSLELDSLPEDFLFTVVDQEGVLVLPIREKYFFTNAEQVEP